MATQTTRYADQKLMDALLQGTANVLPAPGAQYVGLLRLADGVAAGTTPTRDNVVEIAPANTQTYARIARGATTLTPTDGAAPAYVSNNAQWLWAEAGEDWGTIVGIGLFDAAQGGNLWWALFSAVADQRTIRKGDRLNVPAGEGRFYGGVTN